MIEFYDGHGAMGMQKLCLKLKLFLKYGLKIVCRMDFASSLIVTAFAFIVFKLVPRYDANVAAAAVVVVVVLLLFRCTYCQ